MVQIIPSVLATSEEQYQADISKLATSESLKDGWVHIDFADNIFVQNKTIEPGVVAKYPNSFQKQAHLMVADPLKWIDQLVEVGFETIIFHAEVENVEEVINYIKSKGKKVGLAIKQETTTQSLKPFINSIDIALIMTIVAGFQGQKFIPEVLNKIAQIKNLNPHVYVGVDGGVSDENVKLVVEKGADFFILGSYLLKGDPEENLESIWEEMNV